MQYGLKIHSAPFPSITVWSLGYGWFLGTFWECCKSMWVPRIRLANHELLSDFLPACSRGSWEMYQNFPSRQWSCPFLPFCLVSMRTCVLLVPMREDALGSLQVEKGCIFLADWTVSVRKWLPIRKYLGMYSLFSSATHLSASCHLWFAVISMFVSSQIQIEMELLPSWVV